MRQIYAIGETVYDIIFREGIIVTGRPGGSMLNSAVSMGRAGLPVHFISEYGQDDIGAIVDSILLANSIDTRNVYRYTEGKTTVTIASLDKNNNAKYTFYRDAPKSRLGKAFPQLQKNDVLLFGSYYALAPEIRAKMVDFICQAKNVGAFIVYDPNYRTAHLHELEQLKPRLIENMQMASVIKGSEDDFNLIFGAKTVEEAFENTSKYCKYLFYTMADKGVYFISEEQKIFVPSQKITPISTIGAGDNFSAGIIYSLYNHRILGDNLFELSDDSIKRIIETGIAFASDVCQSFDNYVSANFANSLFYK